MKTLQPKGHSAARALLCAATLFATPLTLPAGTQNPICHYVFGSAGTAPDLAGHYPAMRLSRGTPDPGPVKGGIRLEEASLSTQELILTNAFTVCLWVRPLAFGKKTLARDWPNGMLVCSGSGYYDGWRILLEERENFRPVFEIGRKGGAVSVTSGRNLAASLWHLVGATWAPSPSGDQGVMRLYLDGELVAESSRGMPPPLPPTAPLSIGYCDFGVGSVLADFGELSIYESALTPEQLMALFLSRDVSQDLAPPFARAEWMGARALANEKQTGRTSKSWSSIATNMEFDVIHRVLAAARASQASLLEKLLAEAEVPAFLRTRYERSGTARQACRMTRHPSTSLPRMRLYLSPSGLDTGSGTESAPFRTLERARDEIRRLRQEGFKKDIAVLLGSGRYPRTTPFILDARDSATPGARVIYATKPGEPPAVLDGGLRFDRSAFHKVTDTAVLTSLPDEARDRVLVAEIPHSETRPTPQGSFGVGETTHSVLMLTANDSQLLTPARWPNQGFITSSNIIDQAGNIIGLDTKRAERWTSAPHPMAHGYWMYTWADAALPIQALTTHGAYAIKVLKPHSYGMGKSPSFYIFNLLEELDTPGEWFYEVAQARLFLIPPEGVTLNFVTLTTLDQPLVDLNAAANIEFRGLSFRNSRSNAIRIRQSHGLSFTSCDFQGIGGPALDAQACDGLVVRDSSFRNLGHGAIIADAGDRRTLRPGNVRVHHNTFSRVGQFARTYTPGCLMQGVGALICHNEFFDMPSSAMRIEGNDHIIEFNDIHDVVMESDDQGAVDMWGNPSYRRCLFRYNSFRNIGNPAGTPCGQCAIRFDDMISGMIVHDNLFENASRSHFGAVQIHGGSHNIICFNTIRDCNIGISFAPWEEERWLKQLTTNREVMDHLYKEVDITQPPYSTAYPELSHLLQDINHNFIWDNTLIRCGRNFLNLPNPTDTIWN